MNEYKYMREGLDSQYGILQLQDKILEIAMYIDSICNINGINYCLMGGSALGAKRHNGFIPWDDDLDIFMTPDNYEKFRECFYANGDKKKYYLQEWGAIDGMVTISKLRMNDTTYIESMLKDWNIHQGIYVDIFILHTCPNNKFSQLKQFFWAKYLVMKGLSIRNYDRRGGIISLVLSIMKFFPNRTLVRYGLKQVYKYRNSQTKYYCNFLGKAIFKNAIYKRKWFEKTVYGHFEKVELKIPQELHTFLSYRFGDYMKIPSSKKIKREQHAEFWSVSRDYRESLKRNVSYIDEKNLI